MRIARGISIANTSKPISTAIVYDADAAAFFTAASITDTTQKSAVNTLVLSLKSANIWTKMKALYPVVGGVASAHAINLKQPGTFNLSFATGWTHSSTGMTPNGATYANTFVNPRIVTPTTNHLSFYSRTNYTATILTDIGIYDIDANNNYFNQINSASNYIAGSSNIVLNFSTTNDSRGFWLGTKRSNSDRENYLNGISQNTSTVNDATLLPNNSIYLGARNQPSSSPNVQQYSIRQCAFASIGDGLTDTDATNFYNAVQTFQTTLGRQV